MIGSPPPAPGRIHPVQERAPGRSRAPKPEDSKPMRSRPSPRALPRLSRRTTGASLVAALLLAFAPPLSPGPAAAVLIATGTGAENTSAPNPDPGFARLGVVNGLSGVYFRNGWVLTANHVGTGTFWLGGTGYLPVSGSTVRMSNPDGTLADLIAFKLSTRPPIADVALTNASPSVNTLITVIGNGFSRGPSITWENVDGWEWASPRRMRWGTNRISTIDELVFATQAFSITFDEIANPPNGQHEADMVTGDSGGGAFVGSGASAELVGILFARASFAGQEPNTSFFGNRGFIVNLFAYREDLLALVDQPDCNDGIDEDGDGLVDFPADPGCAFGIDPSENTDAFQCDNGIDDDGDLTIDFPADSGCLHPTNPIEAPEPAAASSLAVAAFGLALAARRKRSAAARAREGFQTSSTRSTR